MDSSSEKLKTYWFVGASYGGTNDQTDRFVKEGIWEHRYQDKYLDTVKSMAEGDRIAIKAAYIRKKDLPFDNRGHIVSVMTIKAIGTITKNRGDGHTVEVDWEPLTAPREWYFYTNRATVWRVTSSKWSADELIKFTFENKPQDIDRFRNDPFWRERFGDIDHSDRDFQWTTFYEALADKLLTYRNRRDELVAGLHEISTRLNCMAVLNDQYEEGVPGGPLQDICPFTVMGTFNRGITDANRKIIAQELAQLMGVSEPVPTGFDGIPLVNNQRTWFFAYSYKRKPNDIDTLWDVFAEAIAFSESDNEETRSTFAQAYDRAMQCWGVKWNLSMGLYWIRPWHFLTLDSRSRHYITHKLHISIGNSPPPSEDYLKVLEDLQDHFQEPNYPIHSFPELSWASWIEETAAPEDPVDTDEDEREIILPPKPPLHQIPPYSIDAILKDGCFLSSEKLETILNRLRVKKNIILQGPPGTGKTWLAKRLAFALVGQRDESKVRPVQFHPNLSYEDFIRGWRPTGEGKLNLVDGIFTQTIAMAQQDPASPYVVVIEEINRGNPAQIFGEMLTLLEADKRNPDSALELSYKRSDRDPIFIPENLYVIGTMNIADRSLALVDLALRRRFAFIDLEPTLGQAWRDWVQAQSGIESTMLEEIEKRIQALNADLSVDPGLGPQFRVGHSYVTPTAQSPIQDAREWFRQVVETEIGPLLDEYWFDALGKAQQARQKLLQGF